MSELVKVCKAIREAGHGSTVNLKILRKQRTMILSVISLAILSGAKEINLTIEE